MERTSKKSNRVQDETYVDAADPLTKVIVMKEYPNEVITAEQLAFLRGVVQKRSTGSRKVLGSVPRSFYGTSLKSNAAVVKYAKYISLS